MITKIILHSYDEEDDDNRENEEERISSNKSDVEVL